MKGNIIYKKTIPARSPEYAEFPKSLHPDIQDFLSGQNIKSLYTHQAEAFSHAMAGENIVITTPTASGKSLCFYLPVVQEILKDPVTRAIFIYPTKALAADQYRALIPWMEALGEHRLSVGVYDGDTPPAERKRIRERANIILTNPDMLNGSMLPNHSKYGFDFIFSNLKYIILDELHVPFVINQNCYNIFDRTIEHNGLKATAEKLGKGIICFSPLAQGMLSDRYLNGIPEDSRVRTDGRFLQESRLGEEVLGKIRALNEIAEGRGQTLAEMALAWLLKEGVITSVLAGASKPSQILYNIKAVENTSFTQDEIETIDRISR